MTPDITEATVERVAAELDSWNVENDPHGLLVEMVTTMRDAAVLLRTLRARLTEVERERDEAVAGEPEKCRYCGLPAAYHDEFQMCTQATHSITKRGPV